jgi:hypothetical protein
MRKLRIFKRVKGVGMVRQDCKYRGVRIDSVTCQSCRYNAVRNINNTRGRIKITCDYPVYKHRSAKSGLYITPEEAAVNRDTTMREKS